MKKRRILIVDNNDELRVLLEQALGGLGHEVIVTGERAKALRRDDLDSFDLIISDVKMPEISGAEFYSALRRKGAALERRLIFVTGDLMNAETLKFVESTGCPWLGKPFDIAAILRTISACLSDVRSTAL